MCLTDITWFRHVVQTDPYLWPCVYPIAGYFERLLTGQLEPLRTGDNAGVLFLVVLLTSLSQLVSINCLVGKDVGVTVRGIVRVVGVLLGRRGQNAVAEIAIDSPAN